MKPQAFVLLGTGASGKGTVAESLIKRGFVKITVSDLIKEAVEKRDPLFSKASESIAQGKRLGDDEINYLVGRSIEKLPLSISVVFDGAGRTFRQVEFLRRKLLDAGYEITFFIFRISLETAQLRAKVRTKERKDLGLQPRPDDDPNIVEDRFSDFTIELIPTIILLTRYHLTYHWVDAEESKEKVFGEIFRYVTSGVAISQR